MLQRITELVNSVIVEENGGHKLSTDDVIDLIGRCALRGTCLPFIMHAIVLGCQCLRKAWASTAASHRLLSQQ